MIPCCHELHSFSRPARPGGPGGAGALMPGAPANLSGRRISRAGGDEIRLPSRISGDRLRQYGTRETRLCVGRRSQPTNSDEGIVGIEARRTVPGRGRGAPFPAVCAGIGPRRGHWSAAIIFLSEIVQRGKYLFDRSVYRSYKAHPDDAAVTLTEAKAEAGTRRGSVL